MLKRSLFAVSLIAGCSSISPLSQPGTLVLKPQVIVGELGTQAVVAPYTQASIASLVLKIYTFDGLEHDLGLQRTLLNAQLDNPIVFSNLKPNTTYRIKAYAYASGSLLISTEDVNSYTDIVIASDDRPTVGTLKVKLVDRAFNGQATSSLVVNPGGYVQVAPEQADLSNYTVTTLAGSGVAGFGDGYGTSVKFNGIYGIATDAQGRVYVGDFNSNRIRVITPTGVVSTLAGGAYGFADGAGTSAKFGGPYGVAVDSAGNVYVGDRDNNCVRKVTAAGVVSTLAGGGGSGLLDATGTSAKFNAPRGVAVDASGNVYVGDRENHCVRKVTPAGVVSTLGGNGSPGFKDGTGTNAQFYWPMGVVVDATGNVYVGDSGNHRIRMISPSGVVSTIAGNGTAGFNDGPVAEAVLSSPIGLALDAQNNLYFADYGSSRIRRIRQGFVSTLAGKGGSGFADGNATAALFNYPRGVAVDSFGNFYVTDSENYRVRKIN